MFDSLIGTVLANILGRELEAVPHVSSERRGVVHEVDVLLRPLAEVSDEPVHVVALGHVKPAVGVVFAHVVHQLEGHVLIVNVEDKVGTLLVNQLGQVLVH